jgi:6,7-dimethyl-8-ribityllumazine synthase
VSSAQTSVTFAQATQAALTITTLSGTFNVPLTLATSGGSSTGAVTYAVVTGTGCAVTGSSLSDTTAGTCLVTATKAGDTNYLAVSSAQTSVTFAQATQAALTITTLSGTFNVPLTLTTTGGAGTGAVTYAAVNGTATGCLVTSSSSSLSSTTAGTCLVTATKAADTNYSAVSSVQTTVTIAASAQAALTLTSTTGTYGTKVTLASIGGSGTGALSYAVVVGGTASGCLVTGSSLSVTSAGTCLVTATKGADLNYSVVSSIATTVTFAEASQPPLTVTSPFGVYGQLLTLTTSGGAGKGLVTYATSNGTARGCLVSGSSLTAGSTGTCAVIATKANDGNYLAKSSASTSVTFTVAGQAALSITSTTGTYGSTITLATSGGLGNGLVTYTVASGTASNCTLHGAALTATTAGNCLVNATKASDGNFASVTSGQTVVTFNRAAQAKLTITSLSGKYGKASKLTDSGGSGTGKVNYSVVDGSAKKCHVKGSSLTTGSAGTCLVRATKAADRNHAATSSSLVKFHFVRAAQRALLVTSTSGTYHSAVVLATTGGSGTGHVSYRVVDGTAARCLAKGTSLTSVTAGTCLVKAAKALDRNYVPISSVLTTVTFAKVPQVTLLLTSTTGSTGVAASLVTSGGGGIGEVSFSVTDLTATGCAISGTPGNYSLSATSAGTCLVLVYKAADRNHFAARSAATPFNFGRIPQPTLRITTTRATIGSTLALRVVGGSGTGLISYHVVDGTATQCVVTAHNLVAATAGTCMLTATKAGDRDYLSETSPTTTITFLRLNQVALRIVPATGTVGTGIVLVTSGGSGNGQLIFVLRAGSSTSCALTGSTLRASAPGTCRVRATKKGDGTHRATNSATVSVRFTYQIVAKAISVSPTSGLKDREKVRVSGSGLTPHEHVMIAECLVGATSLSMCDQANKKTATANASGVLASTYLTVATGQIGEKACGTLASDLGACEVVVSSTAFTGEKTVPITFSRVAIGRTFYVTPSTHLRNGEVLTMSGSGFTPGDRVYYAECLVGAITEARCDLSTYKLAIISPWGVFPTKQLTVKAGQIGGLTCGTSAGDLKSCDVSVANSKLGDAAVADLTFAVP